MPKKLSQIWLELKRRNVVRVVTVYAGAAFVILELVDIIAEPLKLPSWLLLFVIILLSIGFIFAVILSWIYDFNREGRIVKTQPTERVKADEIPKSSNNWKMASYISFVVIVGLIVLNIIPRTGKNVILDKSIAVMPPINDSPSVESVSIINGYMASVHDMLYQIKDLKVLARASTEQYRNNPKPIGEIAKELRVGYLLSASGQIYNNKIRLIVQLMDANENLVWSNPYDREINDVDDHIEIQSEIAQLIANELQATITPEEKKQMEKIPTQNLDAYEYYLLGKNIISRESRDEDFWRAIEYFEIAVRLDSTFALAYAGLAEVYYHLVNYAIHSPKDAFLHAKNYSEKALSIDNRLASAHSILAIVKQTFDYDFEGAENQYKLALEIDPRNYDTHLYYSLYLAMLGRFDDALFHINIATELDPFSTRAAIGRIVTQYQAGFRTEALESMEAMRDSLPELHYTYWFSAVFYADLGMYEEALVMLEKQIELMGDDNISDEIGLQGYLYGKLGQVNKAEGRAEELDRLQTKGYYIAPRAYAWIHFGLGDINKAIQTLEQSFEDQLLDPLYIRIFPTAIVESDQQFIALQQKIGIKY